MKKKLIRIFACMLAFAAVCVLGAGCAREPIQSDDGDKTKPNIADFPFYNADYMSLQYVKETYESSMTKPYWLGNVIYNELALPILYDNGDAYANLLYTPLTVVSVMDQKLSVTYEEGKDYVVDKENIKRDVNDIEKENIIERIDIAGPGFINFYLNKEKKV